LKNIKNETFDVSGAVGPLYGSLGFKWLTNLMHKNLFHNKFYFMPLHVSSTCAYHQDVKIALHSLWYNHTYRCDYTRGCVMQFWHPDDKHMCSKHVEAWNKTYCETNFCASSWL